MCVCIPDGGGGVISFDILRPVTTFTSIYYNTMITSSHPSTREGFASQVRSFRVTTALLASCWAAASLTTTTRWRVRLDGGGAGVAVVVAAAVA